MRVTRSTIRRWVEDLEQTLDEKDNAVSTAEDTDYPDEERIDKLNEEIEKLEEIRDLLEEYIEME